MGRPLPGLVVVDSPSEELLALVRRTPAVLFVLDACGVVRRAEGAGLERLGLATRQVLGRSVRELFPADSGVLALISRGLDGEAAAGTVSLGEGVIELQCAPRLDPAGRPAGLVGLARDVTEQSRAERGFRDSESRRKAILESALEAVVSVDADGVIAEFNPAAERMFGHSRAAALGRRFIELLVPPAWRARHEAAFERYLSTGDGPTLGRRVEVPALRADGTEFPVELTAIPMDSRSQTLFTAFLRDISDRRQAEEARLQLSAIVESSDDAIVGNSLDGTILTWNNGAERIYGYTAEEAVGRSIAMLAPPERAREVMVMLGKIGLGERVEHYETCRVRKDGSPIQVSLTVSPVKDATGRTVGASAIARDITERKKAEEEVRRLAFHDTLTDLPNRLLFQDRLAVAIAQARRSRTHVAVIFVDLDGFKRINDSLGHSAGDDLLRRVADRIRSCLREADTVARFGGDEFVVLVPGIASSDDAERIGDKLLKAMRTPFGIDRRKLEVTASLGISVYPGDGRDGRTLLRNADRAMYRAKEGGRDNLQLYKAALSPVALERLALERQLRDAMGQGDLVVHYQPFVDLESGEIRGAEALIRWQHPSLGLLEPSEFVSLAESSGLIVPIGRWILRTACEQARSWRTRGHPGLRIAVNLSSREFLQPDLVETVRETLRTVGLDSTSLDLEITESSALHNPERVVDTLSDLRSLGVTIAMDDFGTGYSSLSHLRSLPIDRLKIDQSFVRDVASHRGDAAIATAVIAMAHSLEMSVVAEGVETVPQLAFLRARRCDEMQGYLVSRPLPPDRFTEFLSWRRSGRQAPWGPTVRPGSA